MTTLSLPKNKVAKGELALVWSDYWKTWSRLLYAYHGTFVEVDLTPVNPKRDLAWNLVEGVNIRRHYTHQGGRDKRYTSVVAGSIVFRQVYAILEDHLSDSKIAELLFRDFLPEISWDLYKQYNTTGNGVFFKDCRKQSIQ